MKRILLAIPVLVLGTVGIANATKPVDEVHKINICHRDNSVKKPYQLINVDVASADGDTGNDNGKGDHSEHTGPIATSQSVAQGLKDSKTKWGDIIPAHDNYAGLNWTTEGMAIFNNDCKFVTPNENPTEKPSIPEHARGLGGVNVSPECVKSTDPNC